MCCSQRWLGRERRGYCTLWTRRKDTAADGGLIFDRAGNLYGTAFYGGRPLCNSGCGVVFKLAPSAGGWTYSTIYQFSGMADGFHPSTPLIFDADGNLYGMTAGGYNGYYEAPGTVFKLTPNGQGGWSFSLLHTFTGGTDGVQPVLLVFDHAGNLYGMNSFGGDYGYGSVFKLVPTSSGPWKASLLHSFTGCQDGAAPFALVPDANGNLYGSTMFGGTGCNLYGHGLIFKLTPAGEGWKETAVHLFSGEEDGGAPLGLVLDSSGNIYGAAAWGGNKAYCRQGCGLVFRLTSGSDGTWTETVLHNFNGGNGLSAQTLVFGNGGNLFGTTQSGGSGQGLVFELAADQSWAETVLHEFTGGLDGGGPLGPLAMDESGNLYGTATGGGYGYGVVFEVTP